MSGRRRHRVEPRSALRAWIAAAVALVLALGATLAWLVPCGAHALATSGEQPAAPRACCPDEVGEPAASEISAPDAGAGEDRGADCDCPVECGACCAGLPVALVIPPPQLSPRLLPGFTLLSFDPPSDQRADGARLDILHVPRS